MGIGKTLLTMSYAMEMERLKALKVLTTQGTKKVLLPTTQSITSTS
jgi:hypothetical protein